MINKVKYTTADLKIKKKALTDLFYLNKEFLNYNLLEENPHRDVCNFVQNTRGDILDLEPRDHFKTTCISIGYSIQRILNDFNIKGLISHKRMKKSREILGAVKLQLETNPKIRYYFGNYVGDYWSTDSITVRYRNKIFTEPTLAIGGVDHDVTGGHFNFHINDDICGLSDMWSEKHRARTLAYYRALRFTRDKGNYLGEKNVGTRWHLEDIWNYIMKNRAGIKTRIMSAILPNGKSYFPSRYPIQELKAMLKEDELMFQSQMMNDPRALESQVYHLDELRTFDPDLDLKGGTVIGALDPAVSKSDKGCFTALIIGIELNGILYIVDAIVKRLNTAQMEALLVEKCKKWKIRVIDFENNGMQEAYRQVLQRMLRKEGCSTELRGKPASGNKTLRINTAHKHIVEKIMIREDWEDTYPLLMSQLFAFPEGKFIDGPDALEILSQMFGTSGKTGMRFA